MIIEDLKALNVDFLTAQDISQILGCRPQSIRNQAHKKCGATLVPSYSIGKQSAYSTQIFYSFHRNKLKKGW